MWVGVEKKEWEVAECRRAERGERTREGRREAAGEFTGANACETSVVQEEIADVVLERRRGTERRVPRTVGVGGSGSTGRVRGEGGRARKSYAKRDAGSGERRTTTWVDIWALLYKFRFASSVDGGLRLASGTVKKSVSNVGADRYKSARDAEMERIQLDLEVPYLNLKW